MSTPASSEFIALCRVQLRLLADGLGATLSIVYITKELDSGGESKLLPVAIYPETEAARSETLQIAARSDLMNPDEMTAQTCGKSIVSESIPRSAQSQPQGLNSSVTAELSSLFSYPDCQLTSDRDRLSIALVSPKPAERGTADVGTSNRHQILLPLVSEGTILGLLMTTRETQPWNVAEEAEIQNIAQTIALAGILDRRQNWLARELKQQQQLQLQQQDLMHNLLHQLRNPLTAIRTFGKLLIKRLHLEDNNRGVANSIVRESDRLQELLTHLESAIDIPIISSTDDRLKPLPAGRDQPVAQSANLLLPDAAFRIESCQLVDVIDPLVNSAEAIAQERNLSFYTHIPRDLPLVQAHPAALREVLSNLIDNALKYTPSGGEIDLDVELVNTSLVGVGSMLGGNKRSDRHQSAIPTNLERQAHLQICIRDTGVGIPPQDLERLFTRHYRGVQAQGSIAGTGLGLAIAKELVLHMHGRLEVTSPPPGSDRGTEFILWLKLVEDEN
ncbi:HAMP domain-containing sensor histidine kinase [Chamaesiphon sp. OTE_75_metabat_556]|uniref:sensor histidine kinase n=1 Tax=Chamaesiphon sp. OTE_75_metabat_556 TaxID=2964692 RepID=UPI00286C07CB|nr:HAMP domain-containing sensor histidine kinase [Chamaesiphon sp. OTE_75_metabat_556]